MEKWKQTLLKEDSYSRLKQISDIYAKNLGVRKSYGDIIKEMVEEKLALLLLPEKAREYLYEYVHEIIKDDSVMGIRLFGSVAKMKWNKYSDIDLFIVLRSDPVKFMDKTDEIDNKLYYLQKELFKEGYGFYVSPLIVDLESLKIFKPIYLEIVLCGITLFDRKDTISNFVNNIKKTIKYHPYSNGGGTIEWRKK